MATNHELKIPPTAKNSNLRRQDNENSCHMIISTEKRLKTPCKRPTSANRSFLLRAALYDFKIPRLPDPFQLPVFEKRLRVVIKIPERTEEQKSVTRSVAVSPSPLKIQRRLCLTSLDLPKIQERACHYAAQPQTTLACYDIAWSELNCNLMHDE